jgi:4-hydroxy-3-polyprenylbenzoate decarboxylase
LERLRGAGGLASAGRWEHSQVKTAASQQVLRIGADVDLFELPALKCWPRETRRAITAGIVYCGDSTSRFQGAGLYRLEVADRATLAIHWHDHQPLAEIFRRYQQQGQPMPVAIILGGDPQDLVLASLSPAAYADPHLWQAVRAGTPVEAVEGKTIPLHVPAQADVVLEGQIDPTAPPVEIGPSAGPFGQYHPARSARTIQVTAITERVNPIVTAMVTAGPPCERTVMTDLLSRITLPLIQTRIPEVVDYHAAGGSVPGGVVYMAIRKTFASQSQKVAAALWGSDEFFLSKMIVLVDGDIDVRDHCRVMLAVAAHGDPARDVHFHAAAGDSLDLPACDWPRTRRMVIDATSKLTEMPPAQRSGPVAMSPEIQALVLRRWEEYGF